MLLYEERQAFQPPDEWRELNVAEFRWVRTQEIWRLSCQHRDLRWHEYHAKPADRQFDTPLLEVDKDRTGILWLNPELRSRCLTSSPQRVCRDSEEGNIHVARPGRELHDLA